jgi:hypothetical protein
VSDVVERAIALKPRLRQVIYDEWLRWGFFPCYAYVDLRGDPTLRITDVGRFMLCRADPFMKLTTLMCWPFRIFRGLSKADSDGISQPVPTSGQGVIRFHTFFTDSLFYGGIRRMVLDPGISPSEREEWVEVLTVMLEAVVGSQISFDVGADRFSVFQFFPQDALCLDEPSAGARFLQLSGLAGIDADADDTFMLLEMAGDFLTLLETDVLAIMDQKRRRSMIASLKAVLHRPYWKLARRYQFNSSGPSRSNYTGVEPLGGVSTWFNRAPEDAPDLVVNVNVLRSMLINRKRWKLFESAPALDVARGVIDFLHRNVESGLFRTDRGYSFYIAEFFCAMFAHLWQVFLSLEVGERDRLDADGRLAQVRKGVLSYLTQDLNPADQVLNPLDAALAFIAALKLGAVDQALMFRWVDVMCDRFEDRSYPYRAYEIFKGKIPTHMIYGSEATTAVLVYEAIDLLAAPSRGEWGVCPC